MTFTRHTATTNPRRGEQAVVVTRKAVIIPLLVVCWSHLTTHVGPTNARTHTSKQASADDTGDTPATNGSTTCTGQELLLLKKKIQHLKCPHASIRAPSYDKTTRNPVENKTETLTARHLSHWGTRGLDGVRILFTSSASSFLRNDRSTSLCVSRM